MQEEICCVIWLQKSIFVYLISDLLARLATRASFKVFITGITYGYTKIISAVCVYLLKKSFFWEKTVFWISQSHFFQFVPESWIESVISPPWNGYNLQRFVPCGLSTKDNIFLSPGKQCTVCTSWKSLFVKVLKSDFIVEISVAFLFCSPYSGSDYLSWSWYCWWLFRGVTLVSQEKLLRLIASVVSLHLERLSNRNRGGDTRCEFLSVFQETRGWLV